jgi:putative flippase GtrA
MNWMVRQYIRYKELIMYVLVGVLTTLFNWVVYAAFVRFMPMVIANALSWFVTVLFAYITNKLFVFESKSWKISLVIFESLAFFGARALTGVFEIVAQPTFYHLGLRQSILGVKGLLAKVLTSAIVMVLNYICSKLFVFRDQNVKKKEQEDQKWND